MLKRLVGRRAHQKKQTAAGEAPNKHLSSGKVNNQMYFSLINYTAEATRDLFLECCIQPGRVSASLRR